MYRGSRLAASFLLFLTGSAATAIALGVAPAAVGGAWPLALLVIVFGIAHFVALFGIARGREWGRQLAITIAEIGGGVSFAGLVAIALRRESVRWPVGRERHGPRRVDAGDVPPARDQRGPRPVRRLAAPLRLVAPPSAPSFAGLARPRRMQSGVPGT